MSNDPLNDWRIPDLRPYLEQADADIKALASIYDREHGGGVIPLCDRRIPTKGTE